MDVKGRVLHVARLKKGLSTTRPLRADELRVIKTWLAERARMKPACMTFFVSRKRKALDRRNAWLALLHGGEIKVAKQPFTLKLAAKQFVRHLAEEVPDRAVTGHFPLPQ